MDPDVEKNQKCKITSQVGGELLDNLKNYIPSVLDVACEPKSSIGSLVEGGKRLETALEHQTFLQGDHLWPCLLSL